MCIDPAISCLPGCVNFNDIKAEGQDFIDRVLGPHPTVSNTKVVCVWGGGGWIETVIMHA